VGSTASVNTEISGFTIAAPLTGGAATGAINPNSLGILVRNSDVLIDKNYIIDAGIGIGVEPGVLRPRIEGNGLIGNLTGLLINDRASTAAAPAPVRFASNTVAFNTFGIRILADPGTPGLGDVVNNIFWQNHDRSAARNGTAIASEQAGTLLVRFNLFSGNGPSQDSPADDAVNVGGGFNPGALGPVTPDGLGNFTGDPAFVTPRDPRPQFDGPAVFFTDTDYSLGSTSAAIDNALGAESPRLDFTSRIRDFVVAGRGFPGRGPADLGAFEFRGPGSTLRVAGASLSDPTGITVTFSQAVDRSTVDATDLILAGDALNVSDPARVDSLTWIDSRTVRFNLAGNYNRGTLRLRVLDDAIRGSDQSSLVGFVQDLTLTTGRTATPVAAAPPTSLTQTSRPTGNLTLRQRMLARRQQQQQLRQQRQQQQRLLRQQRLEQQRLLRQQRQQQRSQQPSRLRRLFGGGGGGS
jgi:hypothetical protein